MYPSIFIDLFVLKSLFSIKSLCAALDTFSICVCALLDFATKSVETDISKLSFLHAVL